MSTTPKHQLPSVPQHVFILCDAERHAVTDLIEEIERVLNDQPATVLVSGSTQKRYGGFIVVEAARGLPAAFIAWLHQDSRITDCVIYDIPSLSAQEHAVIAGLAAQQRGRPSSYQPEESPLLPPPLPLGYTLHSEPRPLLSSHDDYWIAYVWGEQEGEGFLLYSKDGQKTFLFPEEAISLLSIFLDRAPALLLFCGEQYLSQHAPGIALILAHLRALQQEALQLRFNHQRRRRRSSRKPGDPHRDQEEGAERG